MAYCGLTLLIVPAFTWQVLREPTGDHYIGQRMRISCFGFLVIREGLQANASILDPQGSVIPPGVEGDRVRVYELMEKTTGYETSIEFSALSAGDAGTYTCTGTVMPTVPNPYINNGIGSSTFEISLSSELGKG